MFLNHRMRRGLKGEGEGEGGGQETQCWSGELKIKGLVELHGGCKTSVASNTHFFSLINDCFISFCDTDVDIERTDTWRGGVREEREKRELAQAFSHNSRSSQKHGKKLGEQERRDPVLADALQRGREEGEKQGQEERTES